MKTINRGIDVKELAGFLAPAQRRVNGVLSTLCKLADRVALDHLVPLGQTDRFRRWLDALEQLLVQQFHEENAALANLSSGTDPGSATFSLHESIAHWSRCDEDALYISEQLEASLFDPAWLANRETVEALVEQTVRLREQVVDYIQLKRDALYPTWEDHVIPTSYS